MQETLNLDFILTYILPLFYALLSGFLLNRSKLLREGGFSPVFTLSFLCVKIVTGILYTYIMVHYIPAAAGDIELFFGGGLKMYHAFWQNPSEFPGYLANMFTISDFRIGHTDSDFIRTVFDGIKFIHFLLDFVSGGQLYTNVLIFNGLATWLFLRCWVFLKQFVGNAWLGGWIFLFPSSFFFTSVVLKEGIELCLISAILPLLMGPKGRGVSGKYLGLAITTVLLFFFKYLIAATFFASLGLFLLFRRYPSRKIWIATGASLIFLLVFFSAEKLHPALNLPNYIIERRVEFQTLEANSALEMQLLEPTAGSFAAALPEALVHVLLKPLPGEGGKRAYLIFSAEILVFWLLVVFLWIWAFKRGFSNPGPEAWAYLMFALINLLVIGFTITNIGAITRYRSIFLPGIGYFCWVLCRGEWLAVDLKRFWLKK